MSIPHKDLIFPYEQTAYAFYKGTTVIPITPKAWATIEPTANSIIEAELRSGTSLTEIITEYTRQQDYLEQCLVDYQKANPEKTGVETTAEEWLGGAWGPRYKLYWAAWYTNIAMLLRLKVIQNDSNNGWLLAKQMK